MYPSVLQFLIPDGQAKWRNSAPGGKTRRDFVSEAIRALVKERRFEREAELQALIEREFGTISPERVKQLLAELRTNLGGASERAIRERTNEWRAELQTALQSWVATRIFDYTSFTKLLVDHWAAALRLKQVDSGSGNVVEAVGECFAVAINDAFTRGQSHLAAGGLTDDARYGKARNGIARFADAIFAAAKEFANERAAEDRRRIAMLSAAAAWGMMEGFGRVRFQSKDRVVPAQDLFRDQPQSRMDLLRVLPLVAAHPKGCPAWTREWARAEGYELTPIEAFWVAGLSSVRDSGARWFPSPSGATVDSGIGFSGLLKFDVEADQGQPSTFRFSVAVFLTPLSSSQPLREVLSAASGKARYSLILARQLGAEAQRCASTLLTQIPELPCTQPEPAVESVVKSIELSTRVVLKGHADMTVDDLKNYAIDFPLDEKARISSAYLIERPSAMAYVRRILQAPGLYLSCSMRRSGKTTAFQPALLEKSGLPAGAVTVESCRSQGYSMRFYNWIRGELHAPRAMASRRVVEWFESELGDSRLLVLDEYEALFDWMDAEVRRSTLAKSDFFDPLLDGLVEASDRWSVLFLGLNPRAARIFMQDNPVAPRLQASPFPLFQHGPNQGSTEFSELLGRVVTRNFEIEQLLVDRLHFETAGHPHFAVSIVREFIDWVLKNNRLRESRDRTLRADWWEDFAADRLVPMAMMTSVHFAKYTEFHDTWRQGASGPWLASIAKLAESLGAEQVPRQQAADFVAATAGVDVGAARQMLIDASRANIVSIGPGTGVVSITVPLYGRLARGWQ
jgi:hypothetical protein